MKTMGKLAPILEVSLDWLAFGMTAGAPAPWEDKALVNKVALELFQLEIEAQEKAQADGVDADVFPPEQRASIIAEAFMLSKAEQTPRDNVVSLYTAAGAKR